METKHFYSMDIRILRVEVFQLQQGGWDGDETTIDFRNGLLLDTIMGYMTSDGQLRSICCASLYLDGCNWKHFFDTLPIDLVL